MSKSAKLLILIVCFSTYCQVEAFAKSRSVNAPINQESSQQVNKPASPFAVGNFFSASAAAAVKPSVEKRPGPKDAIGIELVDPNPTLEQVKLIPSLDGTQRKQINELFNVYRSDLKVLSEQLRPLRAEFKTRLKAEKEKLGQTKADLPKEEEDLPIREVVGKIKVRQIELTQALGKVVTAAQMLELEQLRRGKVPTYAQ